MDALPNAWQARFAEHAGRGRRSKHKYLKRETTAPPLPRRFLDIDFRHPSDAEVQGELRGVHESEAWQSPFVNAATKSHRRTAVAWLH